MSPYVLVQPSLFPKLDFASIDVPPGVDPNSVGSPQEFTRYVAWIAAAAPGTHQLFVHCEYADATTQFRNVDQVLIWMNEYAVGAQ